MALTDHLAELRARLIRCVIAVVVGFFVAYSFHEELFDILARPVLVALRAHGIPGLQALHVTEAISVYIQVSLVASLVGTAPYLFYQAWAFVAPGLYARERRLVGLAAGLVTGFFLLGVLFCYTVFLPLVVDFLVAFTEESGSVRLLPTLEKTFSIVTLFPVVFGLVFQLPLVMFLLSLLGIFDYKRLLKVGRIFVVLAFILAAVFTPPDPLSQVLMAVPVTLLFFVGVLFAWVGGLLREGGRRTVARVVAVAAGAVFAALVVTLAVVWRSPEDPDPATLVSEDAWFAIRADPSSRLGRAAIEAMGVPAFGQRLPRWVLVTGDGEGRRVWAFAADAQCPGQMTDKGVCQIEGSGWFSPPAEPFSLGEGAIGAVFRPPCASRLAPGDAWEGGTLHLLALEEPQGRVRISFTAKGPARAWRAWLERLHLEWTPTGIPAGVDQTPIGRALAWSAGDFEVSDGDGGVSVILMLTPARAERALADVALALRACHGHGG